MLGGLIYEARADAARYLYTCTCTNVAVPLCFLALAKDFGN